MTINLLNRQDEWVIWSPDNDSEESRFCDLVCIECTKNIENEAGWPVGCNVLFSAINHNGDQIRLNPAKGKVRCLQQQLNPHSKKHQCKITADLFEGAATRLQVAGEVRDDEV